MHAPPSHGLVSIGDLTDRDIRAILTLSRTMADQTDNETSSRAIPAPTPLAGRSIAMLFFENSTRTRASFELAAARLGAHAMNLEVARSSTAKGETLADTIATIDAMRPDAIVIRHGSSGAARLARRHASAPILNAGSGISSHPTQALLDAATIVRHAAPSLDLRNATPDRPLSGLRLAVIGDIAHSRVARSLMRLLPRLGVELTLVGPQPFLPPRCALLGFRLANSLDEGLAEQPHIVYTLRVQRERIHADAGPSDEAYADAFGLTAGRLQRLAPHAFLMHPGPVNRGVELDRSAIASPGSLIRRQVEMGVCTRQAILLRLLRPDLAPEPAGA
jgi:aspartate carbamoyltransferase catalytic subunit